MLPLHHVRIYNITIPFFDKPRLIGTPLTQKARGPSALTSYLISIIVTIWVTNGGYKDNCLIAEWALLQRGVSKLFFDKHYLLILSAIHEAIGLSGFTSQSYPIEWT